MTIHRTRDSLSRCDPSIYSNHYTIQSHPSFQANLAEKSLERDIFKISRVQVKTEALFRFRLISKKMLYFKIFTKIGKYFFFGLCFPFYFAFYSLPKWFIVRFLPYLLTLFILTTASTMQRIREPLKNRFIHLLNSLQSLQKFVVQNFSDFQKKLKNLFLQIKHQFQQKSQLFSRFFSFFCQSLPLVSVATQKIRRATTQGIAWYRFAFHKYQKRDIRFKTFEHTLSKHLQTLKNKIYVLKNKLKLTCDAYFLFPIHTVDQYLLQKTERVLDFSYRIKKRVGNRFVHLLKPFIMYFPKYKEYVTHLCNRTGIFFSNIKHQIHKKTQIYRENFEEFQFGKKIDIFLYKQFKKIFHGRLQRKILSILQIFSTLYKFTKHSYQQVRSIFTVFLQNREKRLFVVDLCMKFGSKYYTCQKKIKNASVEILEATDQFLYKALYESAYLSLLMFILVTIVCVWSMRLMKRYTIQAGLVFSSYKIFNRKIF